MASLHARFAPLEYRLAARAHAARPSPWLSSPAADGAPAPALKQPSGAPTPAEVASAFVERVLGHAYLINEKISQLNALWPALVQRYEQNVVADMRDREHLIERYDDVVAGRPMRVNVGAAPDAEAERTP